MISQPIPALKAICKKKKINIPEVFCQIKSFLKGFGYTIYSHKVNDESFWKALSALGFVFILTSKPPRPDSKITFSLVLTERYKAESELNKKKYKNKNKAT